MVMKIIVPFGLFSGSEGPFRVEGVDGVTQCQQVEATDIKQVWNRHGDFGV